MAKEPGIGHNSGGGVAAERLMHFLERVERLDEERRDVVDQIKDVFAEAKGEGFDVNTMRRVLRLRAMKPHDRSEQAELLELYASAAGIPDIFL